MNRWFIYSVECTREELEERLAEHGVKFVGEEPFDKEDLGLHFGTRILTETPCTGFDEKIRDEIYNKIREFPGLEHYISQTDINNYCRDMPIITDKLDILVCDGEIPPRPSHFVFPRTYDDVSVIEDETFFWNFMETCAYVSRPGV